MYTHTPMGHQQMSQHSQHESTARIRVPNGPFGLAFSFIFLIVPRMGMAEQGLLFEHFLFEISQAGWERLNQSAAIFC